MAALSHSECKSTGTTTATTANSKTEITTITATENSVSLSKLSSALFRINGKNTNIEIVHFVGNSSWIGIGQILINGDGQEMTYWVFKEEMLYLMECGCCELIIEYRFGNEDDMQTIQTVIGLRNTFTLFSSLNFNIYTVHKRLRTMNYVVKRTDISLLGNNEELTTTLGDYQSQLSNHFEMIQYWIWEKGDHPWWKARKQAFEGNSISAVKKSMDLILQKRPDSLVLVWKPERPEAAVSMNNLHRLMKQMGNMSITLASVEQGDVELLKIARSDLFD